MEDNILSKGTVGDGSTANTAGDGSSAKNSGGDTANNAGDGSSANNAKKGTIAGTARSIPQNRTTFRVPCGRVVPIIITLVVIMWAKRKNLFAEYQGIERYIDLMLMVFNELLGFSAEVLVRFARIIHLREIWEWFQNLIFFVLR